MKAAGSEEAVVFPDNDPTGEAHGLHVARELLRAGLRVKVVRLPDLPPKGDVSDWLNSGRTAEELVELVQATPDLTEGDLPKQPRKPKAEKPSRAVSLPSPDPWPDPVDGAELLHGLVAAFKRHLALPEGAAEVLALWAVHAHTTDAAEVSPRLALTSPVKRCGKTTALAVLGHVVPRPLSCANVTVAALFRVVEEAHPTLLIDEADSFLRDSEELRGILNSGHSRPTAYVLRCVGEAHNPALFHTWGPVAIALIGRLPGTLEDRSIIVNMRRRLPGERVERFRLGQTGDLEELCRKASRWAADHLKALAEADPAIPDSLHDRAGDNWRPLLAIAGAAGEDWPQKARAVALRLCGGEESQEAAAVLLLQDLRDLFERRGTGRLRSADICEALAGMEERPWPEWRRGKPITARQLAAVLRPFGVLPKTLRMGDALLKGYALEDFSDAFARYLTPPPPNRHTGTTRAR